MAEASSPCPQPGCPNLKPCPDHKPAGWSNNQRRQRLGGKSGWQQQRDAKRILAHHGNCYVYDPSVCTGSATEVDHVVPTFEGGADVDANKRPICGPCHRKKTQAEGQRARRGGQGTPPR